MTRMELRASGTLASIFALRMLGLFLILPVFAVHARSLPGGADATLIGLALGIYGLTQGLLQIPVGMASARLGRKPVIVAGLLVFAAGSFMAAAATDVWGAILGRAIQGAGAISAAVTAFIADATRDSQRTKAMAMVGASIGLTFALSLIGAPLLYAAVGMGGIFTLTGLLALGAIAVVIWLVPAADHAVAAVLAADRAEAAALRPRDASDEPTNAPTNAASFAAATAAGEGAPAESIHIDPPHARDVLLARSSAGVMRNGSAGATRSLRARRSEDKTDKGRRNGRIRYINKLPFSALTPAHGPDPHSRCPHA